MKTICKHIFILLAIIVLSHSIVYASMADFTDEQADEITKHNQEEWQQEQEDRIGKSSNNYLKSLTVEKYNITPEFDKQTINYEIKQEVNEDCITINAETDDEKSSVSGNEKITLNSGENNIRIDVTAENGTVRTYFIKVTKKTSKNLKLKELKLNSDDGKDIELSPEFNEETYEYNCSAESYIKTINVEAIPNDNNVNIEIVGNDDLKEGLNEVLINVIAENKEKTVYKINVNKKLNSQVVEEKKTINYAFIYIIVLAVILLIIVLLKKQNK